MASERKGHRNHLLIQFLYSLVLVQYSAFPSSCNFRLQQHQPHEPIREQNLNPSAIWLDGTVLALATGCCMNLEKCCSQLHVNRSERRKIVTSKIIICKLNQLRYLLLLKLLNLKLFALPFNSKCLIASCSGNLKVQTFDKHKSFNYYISMTQCDLWPAVIRNHS